MRIPVRKTRKLFIGGAFPRSESGRAVPLTLGNHAAPIQLSRASRKDLRDAVSHARKAQPGWAAKTAMNRGQILYRTAEMLESRKSEMIDEIRKSTGVSSSTAAREVLLSVDRLVWHAGWADKYHHLFGTVNPVASSHFNFSIPEPSGIVGITTPDQPSLLALVSLLAPAMVTGNSCVILASEKHPLPSITFSEILATSDVPSGVINILCGLRSELALPMARHREINTVIEAGCPKDLSSEMEKAASDGIRRLVHCPIKNASWFTDATENPFWLLNSLEIKTVWHPVGF